MGFFESYFGLTVGMGDEVSVHCPFPHHISNGTEYYEKNPSAHINRQERLFHCKVCNQGYNETNFISKLLDCSYSNAIRLSKAFSNSEDVSMWKEVGILPETKELCNTLGISDTTIEELHISGNNHGEILFPVLMYGHLIDVRKYTPQQIPKMRSRQGAPVGAVIPLDIWQTSAKDRITLVCAGEKDMAIARSHGFNAITITGGEMSLPLGTQWFKDRRVVIVYDNDEAGRLGATKLASYLLDYCESVKVCTAFHQVCVEDKEDITDFFVKYGKTREDLIHYIEATPYFTRTDIVLNSNIPLLTLEEATNDKYINKMVRSNIQIVAVSESQFVAPTTMTGEKLKVSDKDKDATMGVGEIKDWKLEESTLQDILHLTDNNFNEDQIKKNAMALLKIFPAEKYVKVSYTSKTIVYKVYVTDMFESMNTDTMPMEYVAYSIGTRLESGKKYMATYKLVPHPYKGQQIIMIISNVVEANDTVSNFKLTDEVKANLSVIRNMHGTVDEKTAVLVKKVKGLLGYDGNDTLIKVIDLAYHTVLGFNLGAFQNVRGYLDTIVVGESRVGKSSTAEQLRKTYQLGAFVSLAGNAATVAGLVGGSNKTNSGAFQTRAGIIPQNHKGCIIFEEFSKCPTNLITELTDIRSSNEVRITRVSGTTTLPACVRMISLSNVKTKGGEIKSIASYPNGISIITELVPTAEDIARYDLMAIIGDKGTQVIDPYWVAETPFPDEVYRTRIRWVWSRTADDVIINSEVGRYIIQIANELNATYNCHIKIFGTEAWKKLARLAIAVAGYLVSTDDTYTKLIVLKEHVDFARDLFIELYDNSTFRLKEYVEMERKYNTIDDNGVILLQGIYDKVPQLLLILEQEPKTSRTALMAATGLELKDYNVQMSKLIKGSFIKLDSYDVLPTERFRLGMALIDRDTRLSALGENL